MEKQRALHRIGEMSLPRLIADDYRRDRRCYRAGVIQ